MAYADPRTAFERVARRTAAVLAEEDCVGQFFSRLATAISSGKAHVAGAAGGRPSTHAAVWGWLAADRPQGACVGWLKDGTFYFDMAAALKAIEVAASPMLVGPITIAKRLDQRGMLVAKDGDRLTTKVVLAGSRRRVHAVEASRVMAESEPEDEPPTSQGPEEV